MKRLEIFLAVFSVVFFFAACGGGRDSHDFSNAQLKGMGAGDIGDFNPTPDLALSDHAAGVQKAQVITGLAQYSVMQKIKPGQSELDVVQFIDDVYSKNKASDCFGSIVGAGINSTDLHHSPSGTEIVSGDLVVIDIGATYKGWCSDVTRTVPASGKYTARQKEIVKTVLAAQRYAANKAKPGVHSLDDLNTWVIEFYQNSPVRADGQTLDNFFTHFVGHGIGHSVHEDTSSPLQVGAVFTIEPGTYIESEKIGVRIEDDFIMTKDGIRNLGPNLWTEPEDIEKIMSGASQRP